MRRWGRAVLALAFLGALAPTAASAVSIETVGPPETVFDYDTMACFFNDSPDGTVRAFRDDTGRVQVLLRGSHTRMIGPDLYNLTHDCKQVFNGLPVNPNPWEYDYADWLAAPWTDDGRNLHALVHAEYHGWRIPGWCPGEPFQKCRYNTITFARSTDAGESYQHGPGPRLAGRRAALQVRAGRRALRILLAQQHRREGRLALQPHTRLPGLPAAANSAPA